MTLLMSVASRGNLPVTRELIQQGAQVNTEDNVSTTITYHLLSDSLTMLYPVKYFSNSWNFAFSYIGAGDEEKKFCKLVSDM